MDTPQKHVTHEKLFSRSTAYILVGDSFTQLPATTSQAVLGKS